MPVMTVGEIDREIDVLREHADAWARLGFAATLRHLREMRARTVEVATAWVEAATRAKGIAGTPLAGEEWFSGPYPLLSALDRLGTTLGEIARRGTPAIPAAAIRTRPNGQVVVDVFPVLSSDRILLSGVRAEMWMESDVTAETVRERTAEAHRRSDRAGRVTLVLGAGNIASIPPLDVLAVLFSHRSVAILKLSPVNAYLEPIFTRIFGALIEEGFVRIVEGGADLGAYLVVHPGIDAIHLTGSTGTRAAIAAAAPRKILTCELGNVTPVIVVPGPWSDPDLVFQAAHVATQKLYNAGANCVAAQVLVTPAEWERAPALLARVRAAIAGAPGRPAYYPGTAQRVADALAEHRGAEILAAEPDGVPRVFAANLDPGDLGEPLFRDEVFGPALAQTALPGADPAAFLRSAVAFVNERLRGTLAVSVLIHPRTIAELGAAFDDAIAALRYGCIAINTWPGLSFALPTVSWGAYPADASDETGSGNAVVHNAFLFDRPQKTIVRAPFAPFPRSLGDGERSLFPTPPWFVTHRRADAVGRRMFAFTASPSVLGMGATMVAAIRG